MQRSEQNQLPAAHALGAIAQIVGVCEIASAAGVSYQSVSKWSKGGKVHESTGRVIATSVIEKARQIGRLLDEYQVSLAPGAADTQTLSNFTDADA